MQTGCRGLVAAVASEVIEKSTVVPEILHFPKSSRTSHRFDLFDEIKMCVTLILARKFALLKAPNIPSSEVKWLSLTALDLEREEMK